jgi:hypothetical protein
MLLLLDSTWDVASSNRDLKYTLESMRLIFLTISESAGRIVPMLSEEEPFAIAQGMRLTQPKHMLSTKIR